MVDYLTEIPLPGRTLVAPNGGAADRAADVALPAFVAGPENRLVAATFDRLLQAAETQSAAAAAGAPRFAPTLLALFGPSGTGKTHLARGLVRHWQQQCGIETAQYVTASDFRRQFATAVEHKSVPEFRRQFRERQLLAIDDLHQLPASDHLWRELRYTLDAYDECGGTVVATSARPASTLANLPPDLRSRLGAGLTLQLTSPGSAARVRIIRHASTALGRALSDDAAHRLAVGVPGTAADLFGALFELCASPPTNGASDAARAERLLASRAARRPTLREIITLVARHHGVPQKQLKSSSRKQSAVAARSVAAYLARELAAASYDQIGRALGGRDHTTILHSYRKIDRQRQRDPTTQEHLDELRGILLTR